MPATDNYKDRTKGLDSPYTRFVAITAHDTNELVELPRAIYVGGAGNVTLIGDDDVAVAFTAVPAGTVLHVRPKIIKLTSLTASNIVALY